MLSPEEQAIFDRARYPQYSGHLKEVTTTAEGANVSCGDEILWEIQIINNTLTALRHSGRACAICVASADLIAERLEGQSLDTLRALQADEVLKSLVIPLSPTRSKCALLPFETMRQILEKA
jgi:nitrogen fixation NifU-like protein